MCLFRSALISLFCKYWPACFILITPFRAPMYHYLLWSVSPAVLINIILAYFEHVGMCVICCKPQCWKIQSLKSKYPLKLAGAFLLQSSMWVSFFVLFQRSDLAPSALLNLHLSGWITFVKRAGLERGWIEEMCGWQSCCCALVWGYGVSSDWRQREPFLCPVVSSSGFPCGQPRLW